MRTPVPKRIPAPPAIIHGDCVVVMSTMPDESIDATVTDPPYGLEFMGKEWDKFSGILGMSATEVADHMNRSASFGPWGRRERPIMPNDYGHRNERCLKCRKWRVSSTRCQCDEPKWEHRSRQTAPAAMLVYQNWSECWARQAFRVLKPGGHLLAFGGTRTFHRLTCALEDTGFEIRDCLMWLHGQGFPKSPTALKPAWEPIVLVRKPLSEPSVAANVLAHGTGALNIDACRIATDHNPTIDRREIVRRTGHAPVHRRSHLEAEAEGWMEDRSSPEAYARERPSEQLGRWPANVLLDENAAKMLDEQSGILTSRPMPAGTKRTRDGGYHGHFPEIATVGDSGGASRFFYVAKASRSERTMNGRVENKHPTVKPIALMRWLLRLVTPPGGLVLDPFAGSGSTVLAGVVEQIDVLGIEQDITTVETARARLAITERETKDPPAG